MPLMQNTQTLTQTGIKHFAIQDIIPDYTGIYINSITILISILIFIILIWKISEKWRITYYKLKQEEILKTGEENKRLLKKLDKVLEVLINGTCG